VVNAQDALLEVQINRVSLICQAVAEHLHPSVQRLHRAMHHNVMWVPVLADMVVRQDQIVVARFDEILHGRQV
jgi:hypothetical protein